MNSKHIFQSLWIMAGTLTVQNGYAQEDTAAVDVSLKGLQDVAAEQVETAKNLINIIIEFAVKYSFQVLGGIIVLVLGWIVAGYLAKFVTKMLEKQKVDVTVTKFGVGLVKISIMAFAVIVTLGKFGIEIAPLIAGISVAGFGLSFALQGPLSNFAAGAILIFTKPFKVGDIIEVAGQTGEVTDLKMPRTELRTVDGEMVVIPNKHIVGEVIQNYSGFKRLDFNVGVSYGSDVDKVIEVVSDVVKNEQRITSDKSPKIGISEFADSSINIFVRVWVKQSDYWDVMFDVNKGIFDAFATHKIEIPFPQRDVHISQKK